MEKNKIMDEKNLVSIVMPVYNGEKFIKDAIDSVLNQTYRNWELIIINDGSTDQTEEVIKKLKDERVIYLKQENQGVSAARNLGLSKMKGKYFVFLDSDDRLTQGSLQSRVNHLEENPEVAFVDGKVKITGKQIRDVKRVWEPRFRGDPTNELMNLSDRCFVTISWMVRNVDGVDFRFDEEMTHSEDLWFYLKYAHLGKYDYTQEAVLYFRRTGESAMSDLKGLEKGYVQLFKRIRENFPAASMSSLENLRKKIIKIVFRSYVKNFQFARAMASYFKLKKQLH